MSDELKFGMDKAPSLLKWLTDLDNNPKSHTESWCDGWNAATNNLAQENADLTAKLKDLETENARLKKEVAAANKGAKTNALVNQGLSAKLMTALDDTAKLKTLQDDQRKGGEDYCNLMERYDDLHNENARLKARIEVLCDALEGIWK